MPEYAFVKYESLDEGRIVRILLNRPEARNAQNRGMLVGLNDAYLRAEADDHPPPEDPAGGHRLCLTFVSTDNPGAMT